MFFCSPLCLVVNIRKNEKKEGLPFKTNWCLCHKFRIIEEKARHWEMRKRSTKLEAYCRRHTQLLLLHKPYSSSLQSRQHSQRSSHRISQQGCSQGKGGVEFCSMTGSTDAKCFARRYLAFCRITLKFYVENLVVDLLAKRAKRK